MKNIKVIQQILPVQFLALFFLMACVKGPADSNNSASSTENNIPAELSDLPGKDTITFRVFKSDYKSFSGGEGWGFELMLNGRLYIHQPFIPAIPNIVAFSDSLKAATAAEMMAGKVQKNIIPPALSEEELAASGLLK